MTRPPVEVRRATPADLDELAVLWSCAREEFSGKGRPAAAAPDTLRARIGEAMAAPDVHVLVARHEGAAAGFAALRVVSVLAVEGTALQLDTLFVLPEFRRRGVARSLLAVTTAIAERAGADQVLAGAPPAARESHRFLARLGFSPLVVRRVVATSTLRRRLAGEGQRRGLDDLLSRRRSLRARGLRSAWPVTDEPAAEAADDVTLADGALTDGGPRQAGGPAGVVPDDAVVHVDLGELGALDPARTHLHLPACPEAAADPAHAGDGRRGA